eukprot:6010704-Amphidinium_carterae.2
MQGNARTHTHTQLGVNCKVQSSSGHGKSWPPQGNHEHKRVQAHSRERMAPLGQMSQGSSPSVKKTDQDHRGKPSSAETLLVSLIK